MIIQILPPKNGRQAVYKGITLAGMYTPDAPHDDKSYELPAGTYELVPTKIVTRNLSGKTEV